MLFLQFVKKLALTKIIYSVYFIWVVVLGGNSLKSLENTVFVLWCHCILSATCVVDVFKKIKCFPRVHLWPARSTILIHKFKFYKSGCTLCKTKQNKNPKKPWHSLKTYKIFTCKRKDGLSSGRDLKPERSSFLREGGCLWPGSFQSWKSLKEK